MQSAIPKQFLMLGGEPIVARTINTFSEALPGAEIVVVLPETHIPLWENLRARFEAVRDRVVAELEGKTPEGGVITEEDIFPNGK